MTAARELIGAFLLADIPTRSTTLAAESNKSVYRGQEPQNATAKIDVRISHRRRDNLGSKTGTPRRHRFEIAVTSRRHDKEQEEVQAALVGDIADELVEAYNGAQGGLTIFRAGLTTLRFERSTASRRQVRVEKNKQERAAFVDLELLIWE